VDYIFAVIEFACVWQIPQQSLFKASVIVLHAAFPAQFVIVAFCFIRNYAECCKLACFTHLFDAVGFPLI